MKNLIHIIYIGVLLLLTGCEGKEPEVSVSDDAASLEITFSVPEISISTKGLDDPWDDDLSDWKAWDRFTDGRDLYEVTILLIEEATGNLVGFRDMYASSAYTDENNGFWDGSDVMEKETETGKSAKVSFLYDKPQGGRTIEKLRRGRYQILAVSNYRPISEAITGAGAYGGLKGAIGPSLTIDTPFTGLIENIRESFKPESGIPNFKNTTMYSDIWTFNIVTDDNHLSSGLKGYISTAVEKGFIKLDNGSFSPNESITVADAAYMIASVLKLPGVDSESVSSGESDKTFASLLAATNAGIFDTAEPTQTITKSECAEILCRIDDYMTENNMNRLRD